MNFGLLVNAPAPKPVETSVREGSLTRLLAAMRRLLRGHPGADAPATAGKAVRTRHVDGREAFTDSAP